MAAHGLIGISSSACGQAPECALAVIMVEQQYVQLAIARVRRPLVQTCTPHRCWSSTRDGCVLARFCNPRLLRRTLFALVPEFLGACSSSSIVPHLQLLGCSPYQNRSTSHRIGSRTSPDQHPPTTSSLVVSSVVSRVRWDRAAICGVGLSLVVVLPPRASRTGHHQLPPPGSAPMSPSVSRSVDEICKKRSKTLTEHEETHSLHRWICR